MVEYEARIFQACGHGSKFIEPPMLNVDCSMQGMSSLVSECGFPRHDHNGITEGATSTLLILWALVQGSGGFKWRLDHLGAAVCRGPRGEVSRPGCGRATLAASDCLGQSSFSHFSCPTKSPEHPKKQKTHSHQLPAASWALGLEPGCSYSAQLRARNCRGWSVWSRWSAPSSPTAVPGRPVAPSSLVERVAGFDVVGWLLRSSK